MSALAYIGLGFIVTCVLFVAADYIVREVDRRTQERIHNEALEETRQALAELKYPRIYARPWGAEPSHGWVDLGYVKAPEKSFTFETRPVKRADNDLADVLAADQFLESVQREWEGES